MALKKQSEEPEDLDQQLEELERKLERLRVMFEQFFLGIEARPPLTLQRDVVRLVRKISTYHIRKTSHKFRYQSITQRFNVHRAYWQRTMRSIEEGSNRRDRARVRRRELERSGERIDTTELAKRALLGGVKGEDAVQERRQRLASEGEDTIAEREPYVPAVARKRKRRKGKRQADEVRGASAESLAQRQAQIERAAALERGLSPASPAVGATRLPNETPPVGTAGPVEAPQTPVPRPAPHTPPPTEGAQRLRVKPSLGRRRREAAAPRPTKGAAPPTTSVLENAGVSAERTRKIYEDFVDARRANGQSVANLTYDRLLESMARQVPKLRESHGALRVDFDVVTKGGKVFLKPKTK